MQPHFPIGIFDSGIGGLTVAKALVDELPQESIIYFGDTIHLPYGDKSVLAIQNYAKRITDFLLEQPVKLILIACNSASAAAYEMLSQSVDQRQALIVNVIDPVVTFLARHYTGEKIGLIGTKLTVQSQVYAKKINQLKLKVDFHSLATPLLVPIIEEGFSEHQIADLILSEYLNCSVLNEIKALILGCTHYPLLKKKIENFYRNRVEIIDSSKIVAKEVKQLLAKNKLLSTTSSSDRHFYISDYTAAFVKNAQLFFGEKIKIEALNIF